VPRKCISLALALIMTFSLLACGPEVKKIPPAPTSKGIAPTKPAGPEPISTSKQALVDSLEELKRAMLAKIDADVGNTAQAFTDVKAYWREKRWADILRAPLRALEDALELVARAVDWRSLSEGVDGALDGSKTFSEVLGIVMMVQDVREVGGKLDYGLHGPSYISAIEDMLEAADATTVPPSGFSEEHYKSVIENHLYGTQGEPVVVVPRRAATIKREATDFAHGALQVRSSIAHEFNGLIAELKEGELPEGFPTDEVIAQMEGLRRQVVQSMSYGTDVEYTTYLQGQETKAEARQGAVGDLYRAFGEIAGRVDQKLSVEEVVEVFKAAGAAGSAAGLCNEINMPWGEKIKVVQQVFTLGEVMAAPYAHTFHSDPEEMFYMVPQETLLSLPTELSNLWMIADDTHRYLRYLLGESARETITPISTPTLSETPTSTATHTSTPTLPLTLTPTNTPISTHTPVPTSAPPTAPTFTPVSTEAQKVILVGETHEVGGRDVFVSGSYAYLAAYKEGLWVVDISNPASPRQAGYCETPWWFVGERVSGKAISVFVSGSYAYVANGREGLRIVNVSDPGNPYEVGYFDALGSALDVFVSGSYAYVASGGEGLRIVDVSDPANPKEVGYYDAPGGDHIFISDSYAYISGGVIEEESEQGKLWVVDVSDSSNPREVGCYVTSAWIESAFISGRYAYVATGYAGLRILDISDPGNPHEVGYYKIPGFINEGVFASGSYAYLVGTGLLIPGDLWIVDISDPANPYEVGSYEILYMSLRDVFFLDPYIYTASTEGLFIFTFDTNTRELPVEGEAKRIVSLAPSNTEILFALGLGDRVVGVTEFCDYPEQAQGIEKVGGFMDLSVEKIVSLAPDLVLGIEGVPGVVAKLQEVGIAVLVLQPTDLESIYHTIELVGQAAGAEEAAQALIASMQEKVEAVTAKVQGVEERPKVFYELDATDPAKPYTAGPDTLHDQFIRLAGGVNIAGKADMPWVQFSTEEIISQDPDIIVLGDPNYGVTAEDVAQRPGWEVITAVRNGAIYPIDDNLISRPGPRVVQGIETLTRIIHPDQFVPPSEETLSPSRITSPRENEVVVGAVVIEGTAAHPEFWKYELYYSPMATEQWVFIGQAHETPVISGQLEIWYTTTVPDGAYKLRLRVGRRDGNYDEYFVRNISVSNTVPKMTPTTGRHVKVVATGEDGLRLRSGPGLGYASLKILSDGSVLLVLEGPVEADRYRWWRLQDEMGTVGWAPDVHLEAVPEATLTRVPTPTIVVEQPKLPTPTP